MLRGCCMVGVYVCCYSLDVCVHDMRGVPPVVLVGLVVLIL